MGRADRHERWHYPQGRCVPSVRGGEVSSDHELRPLRKGLAFQEKYGAAWEQMVRAFPEIERNSSNKYQAWEVVDPEKWVPDGYACVRVDSRGAGRSPGFLETFSPREIQDFHDCIEWAALQMWCNGKIGPSGISYYAINHWQVAALKILARQREPAPPANIMTPAALTLRHAPIADCARYDNLWRTI